MSERPRIGELLVEAGVLSASQLARALEIQREDGRRLGTILLTRAFVTESQLTQALSKQLSVPWVSVARVDPPDDVLRRVPPMVVSQYGLFPLFVRHVSGEGKTLYVAMDDPTNEEALRAVAAASGLPVRPMVAAPSEIAAAIIEYYESEDETGRISLPQALIDAAEASSRSTAASSVVEAPGASNEVPADAADVLLLDESDVLLDQDSSRPWEALGTGEPSPQEPGSEDRTGEHLPPEALGTTPRLAAEVVEEDTDRYLLPEVRPQERPAAVEDAVAMPTEELEAPADRPETSHEEDEDPFSRGTVDERVEALEALVAVEAPGEIAQAQPRGSPARSVSLTLLDGTRIDLGAGGGAAVESDRKLSSLSELLALLEAGARGGVQAPQLPSPRWEHYVARLVGALVDKGILTEQEVFDALTAERDPRRG